MTDLQNLNQVLQRLVRLDLGGIGCQHIERLTPQIEHRLIGRITDNVNRTTSRRSLSDEQLPHDGWRLVVARHEGVPQIQLIGYVTQILGDLLLTVGQLHELLLKILHDQRSALDPDCGRQRLAVLLQRLAVLL